MLEFLPFVDTTAFHIFLGMTEKDTATVSKLQITLKSYTYTIK